MSDFGMKDYIDAALQDKARNLEQLLLDERQRTDRLKKEIEDLRAAVKEDASDVLEDFDAIRLMQEEAKAKAEAARIAKEEEEAAAAKEAQARAAADEKAKAKFAKLIQQAGDATTQSMTNRERVALDIYCALLGNQAEIANRVRAGQLPGIALAEAARILADQFIAVMIR